MKKYPSQLMIIFLLISLLTLFSLEIFAATQPPDPGSDPTGGGDPVGGGAPIGNGLWSLMTLAVTYLLWKSRILLLKKFTVPEEQ
jgi:hypothetical protein